uniref:Uncharacterized protein n=1 Tax=Arundo donax TaxID=35708 RepID=A0A0A9ESX9_ARUDO
MQAFPKVRNEFGISIRNNGLWHAVQSHNILDIQGNQVCRRISGLHWNKMSHFSESIYHHPNCILTSRRAR